MAVCVFLSPPQGVSGETAPQVLSRRGKGHRAVSAGGRAGVGPEHQEGPTEHAPDLPHRRQTGNRQRGGNNFLIFFK